MMNIKNEFDFSKGSDKFKLLINITKSDILRSRGKIGKYKSEIDCNSILIGFVGLQKKSYCILQLRKHKCSVCYRFTSHCTCSNKFNGLQLYSMHSNPTAKGKNLSRLDFKSYLHALTNPAKVTETSFRFEQKNKNVGGFTSRGSL